MKEDKYDQIKEIKIEGQVIVLCHYMMSIWPGSHYNSWHLFGHSHGRSTEVGKSLDVGVDTEKYGHKRFYPYSFDEIKAIMKLKGDNFNKLKE
jgi:calcineurin-like phosphoesterase family protein